MLINADLCLIMLIYRKATGVLVTGSRDMMPLILCVSVISVIIAITDFFFLIIIMEPV